MICEFNVTTFRCSLTSKDHETGPTVHEGGVNVTRALEDLVQYITHKVF